LKKVVVVFGIMILMTIMLAGSSLEVYRDNSLIGKVDSTLLSDVIYYSLVKLQGVISDITFSRSADDLTLTFFNKEFNYNFLNHLFVDKNTNKIYDGINDVKFHNGEVLISDNLLALLNDNIDNFAVADNRIEIKSESLGNTPATSVDIIGQMLTKKKKNLNKINVIVIDPGHGGHDPGAIGYNDVKEKDIVLNVALKLRSHLLDYDPTLKIFLTREDDRFIPLFRRTEIANQAEADLFISLHSNAGYRENAQGFETYYYHFKTDESTKIIERIENSVLQQYESELDVNKAFIDIIKEDMIQIQFINESRSLGMKVQSNLDYSLNQLNNYRIMNRGIKRAKFLVLQYALMPSVLIELGFISNRREALLLTNNDYQKLMAKSIANAIISYKEEYELK
jgi:N-acetylmuramoyl-L-alanine amidase